MPEYRINVQTKKGGNAVILDVETDASNLRASVRRKEVAPPADIALFRIHVLTTFCESIKTVLLPKGKLYDREVWYVYLKALLEVLDRLPPGWSYEITPKLTKAAEPPPPGNAYYSPETGWIID